MRLKTFRSMQLKILLVTIIGLITFSSTYGFERIRWKVQSVFGVNFLKKMGIDIQNKINDLSEGKIRFKFYEPNSVVPNTEIITGVGQGQLDAAVSMPAYHANKIPALSFFHGVPFGPGFIEYTAWMRYGGGQELKNRIYSDLGIITIDCFMFAPETAGWFKSKFNRIEELKGKNIRIAGIGAKVFNKLGIKTKLLTGRDIMPAFEKGVIDAAEMTSPDRDILFGFYKVAKYNYYPGWFQQTSPGELIINQKKWKEISTTIKAIIQTSCESIYLSTAIMTNAIQPDAMQELKKKGVIFKTLEDSELDKFKKAWLELAEEESAKDPLFAEVYASYKVFREKYAIWGDRAYLK